MNYGSFNHEITWGTPQQQPVQQALQPKAGGWKGVAASLLPTIGGAIGAVGGSLIAPIAGTAAGGAAGSAAGEFLRQKITGENSAKDLATQSLLGAVPGLFKGVKAGTQALKGAKAAKTVGEVEQVAQTPTAHNIKINYQPSETAGVGIPQTSRATLTNPTVGDLNDAIAGMQNRGFSTTQKLGTTPGSGASRPVTPDFTPLEASARQPVVALTGNKTAVRFGESTQGTPQTIGTNVADTRASVIANGKRVAGIKDAPATLAPSEATPRASRPTLFSKFKSSAKQANQESKGIVVGASAGKGKVVTPDAADELDNFINSGSKKYGGIRAGKPIDQARDAQTVHNNVVKQMDEALTKIDRPLKPNEISAVAASAGSKVGQSGSVTGTTKTLEKFNQKIANAKSVSELEKIRREADDVAYTANGAGKTSAAAQAHAVRDAIDEFITPLSKDYKAVKGDYPLSKDALTATSKASKDAKGIPVPFTDGKVQLGRQTTSGIKNKITARVVGGAGSAVPSTKKQVAKSLFSQFATRAAAAPVTAETPAAEAVQEPIAPTPEPFPSQDPSAPPPEAEQNDPTAGLDNAIQQALANGDYKGLSALMSVADYYDKKSAAGAKSAKPLSAEASKVVAGANSGLEAIDLLKSEMAKDPSARTKTALPGRGLVGGLGNNLLGTGNYQAALGNILDSWARIKTGAAISNTEEDRFNANLPESFDSDDTVNHKLAIISNLFTSVANRTGSAGTDLQATLGAQ